MSLMRRPRGFALWLALLAAFARGLLPGGVMLAHDGSAAHGLTVALCSGGQVRIHTIADAASPVAQAGGECLYSLAALPVLPLSPAAPPDVEGPFAAPTLVAATAAPSAPGPALPPARGPPLHS
ncbi:MAG: hypothetical protein QM661_09120 [Solimonas sp.]